MRGPRRTMAVALALIDGAGAQRVEELTTGWADERWADLEQLLVVHGLNAWLWEAIGAERLGRMLRDETVERIAAQHRANAERIDALHADLRAILAAAST